MIPAGRTCSRMGLLNQSDFAAAPCRDVNCGFIDSDRFYNHRIV